MPVFGLCLVWQSAYHKNKKPDSNEVWNKEDMVEFGSTAQYDDQDDGKDSKHGRSDNNW